MSIPLKDSVLVPFSTNFNDRIVADASTFDLTEMQSAAYTAVHTPYVMAYQTLMNTRANGTRSESLTAAKESAKLALLNYGRQLYAFVSANAAVSDANKILLGINVRANNTRIAAPVDRPAMNIITVANRTVEVHIHDSASSNNRGKPAGAVAAWVYSFVGENYPSDPTSWNFEGSTTRPVFQVTFPSTVAGGTQVWLRAAWINYRQQAGPMSAPISTTLQGGGTISQTASVKMAA